LKNLQFDQKWSRFEVGAKEGMNVKIISTIKKKLSISTQGQYDRVFESISRMGQNPPVTG
jgi:hypothetical protein